MSNPELPNGAVKKFRHDLAHRDGADPTVDSSKLRELSDDELDGFVVGVDPRVAHDLARRAMKIDYPGTELDPDFRPPEHRDGH